MNEAMGRYVVRVIAALTASSHLAPREFASNGMQAGQAACSSTLAWPMMCWLVWRMVRRGKADMEMACRGSASAQKEGTR